MHIKFDIYVFITITDGGLLVLEGIIRPVVSASALAWFIIYTLYLLLKFTAPK